MELTYADRSLRLRIRNDGAGIPPDILRGARSGNFRLWGMRGAAQIGGKLKIWRRVGAGTEVELNVPSSVGYAKARRRFRLNVFRKNTR